MVEKVIVQNENIKVVSVESGSDFLYTKTVIYDDWGEISKTIIVYADGTVHEI